MTLLSHTWCLMHTITSYPNEMNLVCRIKKLWCKENEECNLMCFLIAPWSIYFCFISVFVAFYFHFLSLDLMFFFMCCYLGNWVVQFFSFFFIFFHFLKSFFLVILYISKNFLWHSVHCKLSSVFLLFVCHKSMSWFIVTKLEILSYSSQICTIFWTNHVILASIFIFSFWWHNLMKEKEKEWRKKEKKGRKIIKRMERKTRRT